MEQLHRGIVDGTVGSVALLEVEVTLRARQAEVIAQLESDVTMHRRQLSASSEEYARDTRLCLTIVFFLPEELRRKIADDVISSLREIEPEHYFYPPESLHITIQNVKKIAEPLTYGSHEISIAKEVLQARTLTCPAPKFELHGLMTLSESVSIRAFGDEAHQELVRLLRKDLVARGVEDDKFYVSNDVVFGNITVCRFVHEPGHRFRERLGSMRDLSLGIVTAHDITLVETNIVCGPQSTKRLQTFVPAKSSPE